MATVTLSHDFSGAYAKLNGLDNKLRNQVISAALNKTGDKAKAEMTRQITARYELRAADVRARLNLKRASRSQLFVKLDPFAGSRRRSMNLIRFLERKVTIAALRRRLRDGTRQQLFFKIKKGGGQKVLRGAFIGNKGRTVFIREGRERLPIKALSTIDVPSMFNSRVINRAVVAKIRQDLPIEISRALKGILARAGR